LGRYFSSDNYLKGNFGKEIVRSLLERAGYTVSLYGYEVTMLDAMSKYTYKKWNSVTGRRLTSSPDLLVYDEKDVMVLVEVKTRGKSPPRIRSVEIERYKNYWSDAILVVVVPEGLYAQRINELDIRKDGKYPLSDFKQFQEIFVRVDSVDVEHYESIVLEMLKIFMSERDKVALEKIPQMPQYSL